MSWIWAALLPHPPVLLPEVGRGREREAISTCNALEQVCLRITQASQKPDCIFFLSPHHPYAVGNLLINNAKAMHGSLAAFGAPGAKLSLQGDTAAHASITEHLLQSRIPVSSSPTLDITLDHGSLVPLLLLNRKLSGLPPVILASPSGLSVEKSFALGQALARFQDDRAWAFIASGDLSHRLNAEAPSGFHPAGKVFDTATLRALGSGNSSHLLQLPSDIRAHAGECGLRSILALLGLCANPMDILSYEAPFGVGYCAAFYDFSQPQSNGSSHAESTGGVTLKEAETTSELASKADASGVPPIDSATLAKPDFSRSFLQERAFAARVAQSAHEVQPPPLVVTDPLHPYPHLARLAITRHLANPSYTITQEDFLACHPKSEFWAQRAACFVSIKTLEGTLRGCIGTIVPIHDNIGLEITHNAILAATKDSRFAPLTASENVLYSVDILGTPERIDSQADLNPAIWGVIVTKGQRRGLLLPALAGVLSVEQQLAIAAQKGDIDSLEGVTLHRFSVSRYTE